MWEIRRGPLQNNTSMLHEGQGEPVLTRGKLIRTREVNGEEINDELDNLYSRQVLLPLY